MLRLDLEEPKEAREEGVSWTRSSAGNSDDPDEPRGDEAAEKEALVSELGGVVAGERGEAEDFVVASSILAYERGPVAVGETGLVVAKGDACRSACVGTTVELTASGEIRRPLSAGALHHVCTNPPKARVS